MSYSRFVPPLADPMTKVEIYPHWQSKLNFFCSNDLIIKPFFKNSPDPDVSFLFSFRF